MLKDKKVIIGIGLLIILIGVSLVFILKPEKVNIDIDKYPNIEGNDNVKEENGIKTNISNKLKEDQGFENYKISNASLIYKDGKTTFTANVKNVSKGTLDGRLVDIILLDKKGNEVSKISTYIRAMKADETLELNASISKDVVNAYNFKIVKK